MVDTAHGGHFDDQRDAIDGIYQAVCASFPRCVCEHVHVYRYSFLCCCRLVGVANEFVDVVEASVAVFLIVEIDDYLYEILRGMHAVDERIESLQISDNNNVVLAELFPVSCEVQAIFVPSCVLVLQCVCHQSFDVLVDPNRVHRDDQHIETGHLLPFLTWRLLR